MSHQKPVPVSGIWLATIGGERGQRRIVVRAEVAGRWLEVISVPANGYEGEVSHIVEPSGILGSGPSK